MMLFLDQWKNGEVGGVMPFSVMFGMALLLKVVEEKMT